MLPQVLKKLLDNWNILVTKANATGIPLPLVRDPKTGRGDVALTLVVLSSIWVQFGLVGKVAHAFQGIYITQALNWFYACSALYWARKLSTDGKKVEIGSAEKQDPPSSPPQE